MTSAAGQSQAAYTKQEELSPMSLASTLADNNSSFADSESDAESSRSRSPSDVSLNDWWEQDEQSNGLSLTDSRTWNIRWECGREATVELKNGTWTLHGKPYQLQQEDKMSFTWKCGTVQKVESWNGRTLTWTTTSPKYPRIYWELSQEKRMSSTITTFNLEGPPTVKELRRRSLGDWYSEGGFAGPQFQLDMYQWDAAPAAEAAAAALVSGVHIEEVESSDEEEEEGGDASTSFFAAASPDKEEEGDKTECLKEEEEGDASTSLFAAASPDKEEDGDKTECLKAPPAEPSNEEVSAAQVQAAAGAEVDSEVDAEAEQAWTASASGQPAEDADVRRMEVERLREELAAKKPAQDADVRRMEIERLREELAAEKREVAKLLETAPAKLLERLRATHEAKAAPKPAPGYWGAFWSEIAPAFLCTTGA